MTLPRPLKVVAAGQGLRVEEEPLACCSPHRKKGRSWVDLRHEIGVKGLSGKRNHAGLAVISSCRVIIHLRRLLHPIPPQQHLWQEVAKPSTTRCPGMSQCSCALCSGSSLQLLRMDRIWGWGLHWQAGDSLLHHGPCTEGQGLQPPIFPSPALKEGRIQAVTVKISQHWAQRAREQSLALLYDCLPLWE